MMATSSFRHPHHYDPRATPGTVLCPSSFPDSFKEFFTTLNEDEDGVDIFTTMLEDKLIPRCSDTSSESGQSKDYETFRKTPCRRVMSARTFQRRASEVHYRSRRRVSCSQGMPNYQGRCDREIVEKNEQSSPAESPERVRRRSSSLAVARAPPDIKRFLQAEPPRSEPRSPGVSPARSPRPRSRTASMPLQRPMLGSTRRAALHGGSDAGLDIEYYRLRSFSITAHGVNNLGDSLRSRRSRSISSVTSSGSAASTRDRLDSTDSQPAQTAQGPYRVAMLGASGVGKTALTCQFTTSEYICAYDASLDEEYGQKNVSVLLDGQETELEIIDHPASEMSVESFCATYNADVFVVVYSVEDRQSLKAAEDTLLYLWKGDYMLTRGVILVANKADLERKREVPMVVGRRLANNYGCKFIEASSGIAHNVDELLVGILAQVQLNPQRASSQRRKNKRGLGGGVRLPTAPRLLARLLGIRRRAKSCENLFVI